MSVDERFLTLHEIAKAARQNLAPGPWDYLIGGVGTLHGPVFGAVLYVFLKEYLALRWVDFHLLIFGALFIAIVLLLPGGLVQAVERARRLVEQRD
jgi:hypothetical protein